MFYGESALLYMTWFTFDTCTLTLETCREITLASMLQLSTPTMHHAESLFFILTNSLKNTSSQTATALLPPNRRIHSLTMWPKIHRGTERFLPCTSRAGWHCPEKFQSNQNKQRTRSEETLPQTFGSHLSMGSYAGNSALYFRTWIM